MSSKIDGGLMVRGVVGGTFMGLANLVPGISGGTMLLASGVYTRFIEAVAEVTSFRFSIRALSILAAVGGAAVLAILLLAGTVKSLVLNSQWIMYSLFIGLTLGGIPILMNLVGDRLRNYAPIVIAGVLAMVAISFLQGGNGAAGDESASWMLMFFAGAAGASAMILPGISGGYLLLIMGAYIPILHGIDQLKQSLKAADFDLMMGVMGSVVLPVGLGIVFGVVAVSHGLNWMLHRYAKQTYAFLLGLLIGAVFGLWPFQKPVDLHSVTVIKAQQVQVIDDRLVYVESQKAVNPKDIPQKAYFPGFGEAAGCLVIIGFGFGITVLVAKFGNGKEKQATEAVVA